MSASATQTVGTSCWKPAGSNTSDSCCCDKSAASPCQEDAVKGKAGLDPGPAAAVGGVALAAAAAAAAANDWDASAVVVAAGAAAVMPVAAGGNDAAAAFFGEKVGVVCRGGATSAVACVAAPAAGCVSTCGAFGSGFSAAAAAAAVCTSTAPGCVAACGLLGDAAAAPAVAGWTSAPAWLRRCCLRAMTSG